MFVGGVGRVVFYSRGLDCGKRLRYWFFFRVSDKKSVCLDGFCD